MARFKNKRNGVIVSVADHKADRFGVDWEPLDEVAAPAGYSAQKVADLQAEIGRRNAERDEADQLSTEGKKADLIATLEADDAAKSGE